MCESCGCTKPEERKDKPAEIKEHHPESKGHSHAQDEEEADQEA